MKGLSTDVVIQARLSTISGVLLSQMSFVGKVGITVMYREYGVFKIWWKTALFLFVVQLALLLVLWLVKRLLSRRLATATFLLFLLFGVVGVYFTYIDFTTTSHRLLKMNFHAGVYLFWGAWALACIYFITVPLKKRQHEKIEVDSVDDATRPDQTPPPIDTPQ